MIHPITTCLTLWHLFIGSYRVVASHVDSRQVRFVNDSPSKAVVYWVHPQSGERVRMTNPVMKVGEQFSLETFVGHHFLAMELPDEPSSSASCSKAPDGSCRQTQTFRISEGRDQAIRITSDFHFEVVEKVMTVALTRKNATALVSDCRENAMKLKDSTEILAALLECVETQVTETLEKVEEEIAFQAAVRTDIAHMLENYTCMDTTLDSSPDLYSYDWDHGNEAPRTIHVKHERRASKIHLIENFISPQECEAMEQAAVKILHRATVADGKGGSRYSENRKAMQAGIKVPWDKEKEGHPIAVLSRRVYDYTNHVLGLSINEKGQEDLMSIQYFGRGANDTEPDRYTPHCDGECTGHPHKYGTRMATLVMYCTVADVGGHTNFRNAGVHIKPAVGSGIFFSYIDPETRLMDSGFTEHSGCPVFEGSKKIVTQWVRWGVDERNPWDSFNTLGMKKSEIVDD